VVKRSDRSFQPQQQWSSSEPPCEPKWDFAGYNEGNLLTASSASGFNTASNVFALLLVGHDFFRIFCALAGTLEAAFKRQCTYTMAWWPTIFGLVSPYIFGQLLLRWATADAVDFKLQRLRRCRFQ